MEQLKKQNQQLLNVLIATANSHSQKTKLNTFQIKEMEMLILLNVQNVIEKIGLTPLLWINKIETIADKLNEIQKKIKTLEQFKQYLWN